jgi:hypothetical protein
MCTLRTGGEDGNGEWWKWLRGNREAAMEHVETATNGRHGDRKMARRWGRRRWRLLKELFFHCRTIPIRRFLKYNDMDRRFLKNDDMDGLAMFLAASL